jgi:hypothetical protein
LFWLKEKAGKWIRSFEIMKVYSFLPKEWFMPPEERVAFFYASSITPFFAHKLKRWIAALFRKSLTPINHSPIMQM